MKRRILAALLGIAAGALAAHAQHIVAASKAETGLYVRPVIEPYTVEITALEAPETAPVPYYDISDEDGALLARMAAAEATAGGVTDKALVMQVILNRVADPRFPDTVSDVIYQRGQFSPIADGRFYSVDVTPDCEEALQAVIQGDYLYCDALYFAATPNCWAAQHCEFLFKQWQHYFYR